MNRFTTAPGKGEEFERIWRERETYLDQVPGFVRFALLRGDSATEYISHSTWETRQAFEDWTNSEAFRKGHAQGSLMGILAGPPQIGLYDAVLTQEAGGPSRG
ncbi:MAG: antibiotic biosynthesis monooxygenase [Chloroflexi bacterium]|nr:antibiotic biosynthesis monooxygenase [Chloroflexota bacterium]MDA1240534.1 antibiotic biosynthesis monooxygenase [Chloroflexota bacterium]